METLETLRKRLDEVDNALLSLLNARIHLSREIGDIKKEQGLAISAPERERAVVDALANQCAGNPDTLTPGQIRQLWEVIFRFSREVQN